MSPRDTDNDDAVFDAFLNGNDALSRRLKQLPQPAPSDALTAAILADARTALQRSSSANDAAIPNDPAQRPQAPHFLRSMRIPLSLAAGVLIAVMVGVQWQTEFSPSGPLIVAQAPNVEEMPSREVMASAPSRSPAPSVTAKQATRDSPKMNERTAVPKVLDPLPERSGAVPKSPLQIAQADISDTPSNGIVTRSGPAVSSLERLAAPASAASAAPVDDAQAKTWLALIQELLKAELKQDAHEEWKKFRKEHPKYPVPEKLSKELDALKQEKGAGR